LSSQASTSTDTAQLEDTACQVQQSQRSLNNSQFISNNRPSTNSNQSNSHKCINSSQSSSRPISNSLSSTLLTRISKSLPHNSSMEGGF
jgi:hypothetical protein